MVGLVRREHPVSGTPVDVYRPGEHTQITAGPTVSAACAVDSPRAHPIASRLSRPGAAFVFFNTNSLTWPSKPKPRKSSRS